MREQVSSAIIISLSCDKQLMDEWSKKVLELIPELIEEHKSIHEKAANNKRTYEEDRSKFNEFEEIVLNHIYKEETWVFAFMKEKGIFDDRSEEIASQHQEITEILKSLETAKAGSFSENFDALLELLDLHHNGEENYVFPKALDFIKSRNLG